MLANGGWDLTLILLTWTIWRAPTNASKWRMRFNSAFKGLKRILDCYTGPWGFSPWKNGIFHIRICCDSDMRWCSWLKSCSTRRKVGGSIPDGVRTFHSFRKRYGPDFDSVSKRNEYQKYCLGGKGGRWVGLTTLPPSCADCLEIWEPEPSRNLRACPGLYWDLFAFYALWYVIGSKSFRPYQL